jgi:orotate phosphoribosyltransferase-like protein
MLVVETIGRIRREHAVKGKLIRQIAWDLRVSRNTVRKILRSEQTAAVYQRAVQPSVGWDAGRPTSMGCWRRAPMPRRGSD